MAKLETKIYDARISDLTETEHNPRQISKKDFAKLKKSLKDFPEMLNIREVVIDENNVILGGHQRVKAALANGDETIPVKQVFGLTDEQKRQFVIKDNIANGDWDLDEIANAWDDIPFDDWGAGIKWDEPEQEVVEDKAPEANENEPAKSILGEVYHLGNHRLTCGDSTDEKCVQTLIGGGSIDMVFTDPPYNVAFNGRSGKFDVIENDDLPEEEFNELIRKTCTIIEKIKSKNTYIWCNWKFYGILQQYFKPKACIVWAKNNFGMGKGYRHQHEFCMFNGEIDETVTNETDLWQEKKDTNYEHPTQKPVSLCARALKNTKNAKTILDLFGGSGSTLIACEQLGRKCYMMELDPKYCDVIRKRYWKFKTGSEEGWQDGTKAIQ